MSDCKLTIHCTSYNFGKYIRDAFEGMLNQVTDFEYKIFVFDDASTDDSQEIIREYTSKYPDKFEVYLSEKNTYGTPERIALINKLYEEKYEGEYVAVCEGDDMWIDPHKLQKQVDYMDEHPECSMTMHAARVIDYHEKTEYDFYPYEKSRYLTAEEIILQPGGTPPTASQVFRLRDLIIDKELTLFGAGDYTRQIYELYKGKVYYFNEIMSIYRYNHPGSWTETWKTDVNFEMKHRFLMYDFLAKLDTYTEYRYHDLFEKEQDVYMYDPYLKNPDVNMSDYFGLLDRLDYVSEDNKKRYKKGRERIGAIVRGEYVLGQEETDTINKTDSVLIYGCGEYSWYVRDMLEKKHIHIDGYVISDTQEQHDDINGISVWRLSECPYNLYSALFVLGVGPGAAAVIKKILKEKNISNIVSPFEYEEMAF